MKKIDLKEQLVELRAMGHGYTAIAEKLGITRQTAFTWSKELELEIQNRKAFELEALYEMYHMTLKAKLEMFGQTLEKLHKEVEKRDFNDVPTDKLVGLMIQISEKLEEFKQPLALKEKYIAPSFNPLEMPDLLAPMPEREAIRNVEFDEN